jgi:hypothetical protein
MKKTILIIGLVVLALGVFGVGVALAQDVQSPVARGMMFMSGARAGANNGYGVMQDYVEKALADKLGITEADVEAALASGKTMYQIALDNGVVEADIPALLAEVHTTAFDKAVSDGVITREQADFMLQRMSANGYNDGLGYGRGMGMMGNGGNGQYGHGMMNGSGQYGLMHDYVEEALADKLGVTETEVESALASGKTMYQIVLDSGVVEADAPALLTEVHTTAFDKAVADGVMTREQADFMLQRMTANGFNSGNCSMQNGQGGQYGRGMHGGMMNNSGQSGVGNMMGGRWQQVSPTAQP